MHLEELFYKKSLFSYIKENKKYSSNALVLSEFRIDNSISDIIVFSDEISVFEIKTGLDSLSRLSKQIESYSKMSPCVNILTCQKHIKKIISTYENVGIYELDNNGIINCVRRCVYNLSNIDISVIFDSITRKENISIIKLLGFDTIDVERLPNTKIHYALRDIAVSFDVIDYYRAACRVLHKTRRLSAFCPK